VLPSAAIPPRRAAENDGIDKCRESCWTGTLIVAARTGRRLPLGVITFRKDERAPPWPTSTSSNAALYDENCPEWYADYIVGEAAGEELPQ
jgi:hypothetical protein